MQSSEHASSQQSISKGTSAKRLRIDAFARHIVVLFGLLVLAMFLLLIAHIFGNAIPLLNTPALSLKTSISLSENPDERAQFAQIKQLGNDVVRLSFTPCEIRLESLQTATNQQGANSGNTNSNANSTELATLAAYHHPCTSTLLPINDAHGYHSHYAHLRNDNLIELYKISHTASGPQRALVGSFNVSSFIDALPSASKGDWQVYKYQNDLVISQAHPEHGTSALLWHKLNSLDEPFISLIDRVDYLLPLSRFSQAIVIYQNQPRLVNQHGETIQTLAKLSTENGNIVLSPDQRALYFPTDAHIGSDQHFGRDKLAESTISDTLDLAIDDTSIVSDDFTQVWRNANIDGAFLFSPASLLEGIGSRKIIDIVFDRQTLVGIAIDTDANLIVFNRASSQVLNVQASDIQLGKPNESEALSKLLHWHNQMLYVSTADAIHVFQLENAAGITTYKSLFSELNYSGYKDSEYIWQTSNSAQYAEPKFSLFPLIIGSLKAAVLALFVAIPLALGAAIYTAYFAPSRLRNWVKPSIEMIEAIPSVIIGFVAAIWLAPFAERSLFSLLMVMISLPFVIILMAWIHGVIKQTDLYQVFRHYYLLAVTLVFLLVMVSVFHLSSFAQAMLAEAQLFGFLSVLGELTISKTTVVVALALGIAVAPTIYSLVDDALFEVPEGVKQASFALGATQLQTLSKVVLVVALPSIISAIMLGLGRAFGETMIVLMVTGNTPIADWDLLSGLRSLTSNLTIELQESRVSSAHYHILFLTAAILFAFTFAINTVAALLKRRLQNVENDA
ncbi:ABC transporter permease subunit [Ningiella sp. W23]|uniref:ABC transporter permease subunit n=1 Tax=Ningiella sp. W23 TaxID=3023715 RepID=UPI003757C6FD